MIVLMAEFVLPLWCLAIRQCTPFNITTSIILKGVKHTTANHHRHHLFDAESSKIASPSTPLILKRKTRPVDRYRPRTCGELSLEGPDPLCRVDSRSGRKGNREWLCNMVQYGQREARYSKQLKTCFEFVASRKS